MNSLTVDQLNALAAIVGRHSLPTALTTETEAVLSQGVLAGIVATLHVLTGRDEWERVCAELGLTDDIHVATLLELAAGTSVADLALGKCIQL